MTDHYTRALNLIDDMLHMMDQRPDGPQSAWYKAAWALMQEKPNRGLVYQLCRDGGEWEEITEAVYQFVLSRDDVTGAELRILHTAPSAHVPSGWVVEKQYEPDGFKITFTNGCTLRVCDDSSGAVEHTLCMLLSHLTAAQQPKESI